MHINLYQSISVQSIIPVPDMILSIEKQKSTFVIILEDFWVKV